MTPLEIGGSGSQPGGGVPTLLGGEVFSILAGRDLDDEAGLTDSLSISVDSATVVALGDSTGGMTGLLVATARPEVLLHVRDVRLRIATRAGEAPDNTVDVPLEDLSFIFDPAPAAPQGWLRVGGTPAWRSVLTMSMPRTITGTPEVCGAVGCEVDLTEVDLNLAELVLTTRQTEPAFQPQDTTGMDVRVVLRPELLPKSPLGGAFLPFARTLAPELFFHTGRGRRCRSR